MDFIEKMSILEKHAYVYNPPNLKYDKIFYLFLTVLLYGYFAYMYVCALHVCLVSKETRRCQIPIWNWLELDMVVSCHVGAEPKVF